MATTFPDAPRLIESKKQGLRATRLAAMGLTEESLLARREKVFQLRAVDRISFDEIGKRLGISNSCARDDAEWITKHKIKGLIEKDKSIVAEQDVIYRALLDKWLPVALNKDGEDDTKAMYATDRIARILVDQAKLHGFHATAKDSRSEAVVKEIGTTVLEAMIRLAKQGQGSSVVEATILPEAIEDAQT